MRNCVLDFDSHRRTKHSSTHNQKHLNLNSEIELWIWTEDWSFKFELWSLTHCRWSWTTHFREFRATGTCSKTSKLNIDGAHFCFWLENAVGCCAVKSKDVSKIMSLVAIGKRCMTFEQRDDRNGHVQNNFTEWQNQNKKKKKNYRYCLIKRF